MEQSELNRILAKIHSGRLDEVKKLYSKIRDLYDDYHRKVVVVYGKNERKLKSQSEKEIFDLTDDLFLGIDEVFAGALATVILTLLLANYKIEHLIRTGKAPARAALEAKQEELIESINEAVNSAGAGAGNKKLAKPIKPLKASKVKNTKTTNQQKIPNYPKLPKQLNRRFSEKIWKQNALQKKSMLEKIDKALKEGKEAKTLAKELADYLKPNAKGGGVYKDPKKNAFRLARNEINLAFAEVDYNNWVDKWFIKGYEVRLSHTHYIEDICDYLKGFYPKDFKFQLWHVNCMCVAVPVLVSNDEQEAYQQHTLNGGKKPEIEYVTEPPKGFGKWLDRNRGKIEKKENKPYWWTSNEKYIKKVN